MPLNGVAVTSVAAGSLLVWSGIKGWSLLRTIGEVVTGKAPTGSEVNVLTTPNSGGSSGSAIATSSGIANDALKYVGHAYSYGGTPGTSGANSWDCSSFVNWVVGHDAGRAIPGYSAGQYNGSAHGPPTGSWGVWPGLSHIPASQLQAGDLIVWTGHMGIAISNTQMVSALNGTKGTLVTPIAGYGNGPLMCYGRLK